ncbi:MAG: glutamine-hydrolyzing GMP synthase [Ignavibacteria bacterium]|nr:glutamine-hydrolyzing GMP synthase [Ignavibacteria bacterium]
MKTDIILILDFGSQYTQLIARRLRDMNVYCEIHPFDISIEKFISERKNKHIIKGFIFSGGPASVLSKDSPDIDKDNYSYIMNSGLPVLGICYGLQLIAKKSGGRIHKSKVREYGLTNIRISGASALYKGCGKGFTTWMSHGDSIEKLPREFKITAKSSNGHISSYENRAKKIYALQFHPEVHHTENGKTILKNFVFGICNVKNLFKPDSFIKDKVMEIKERIGGKYVICALSGGVDSSVAASLVHRAVGKKLICIHIDNGLMRKNESRNIVEMFRKHFKFNIVFVDASELFLRRLKGVSDPERKRKIIGKTFIDVFQSEAKRLKKDKTDIKYLVQGTLYPDVIESVSFKGPSVTIKSHHNVGGLPAKMKMEIIEPFRELFKDEVRSIGVKLGLPVSFIMRHPFPGPGLAVRILGDITKSKLDVLREADDIYINELHNFNIYNEIWQAFAVLLPVQSVGVMGDERSYENVIALRAVTSIDGMTADFYQFTKEFFTTVSNKISNTVKGVNRVVYDISSKPPATIEWE